VKSSGRRPAGAGREPNGPASHDAAGGGFEQQQAKQLLTSNGPLTQAALVGLHQGLVDRRLVVRVLEARKSGAKLASGIDARGKSLRQLVDDAGFDWGQAKEERAGAADGAAADVSQFPVEAGAPAAEATQSEGAGPEANGSDAATSAAAAPATGAVQGGSAAAAPQVIARKASGGDVDAAHAGAVVDAAASRSVGGPLDSGLQRKMEKSFGQSFADVRVHTDGASARAAKGLNAHAFTVGQDIYFGAGSYDPASRAGERLVAHELAHVAQGAQGAARATGEGVSVSSPSDPAELAADRAADAALAGAPVGDVGSAPASLVHRDAASPISELDQAAQGGGSWNGHVDQNDLLARFRRLSAADKLSLFMDAGRRDLMTRIVRGANVHTLLFMFAETTVEFRWKIYWLAEGHHLGDLDGPGWRWLLGYASPEDMNALRAWPDGYRLFLQNAPGDMVPPWDFIEGLVARQINPSSESVRNAVNRLDPQQKATLRDRANVDKVRAILAHAGGTSEQFRTCTYLGFELSWSLYWLAEMGRLDSLSHEQWGQILSEAGETQWNALVAWQYMWERVQKSCPSRVLDLVKARYNTSAAGQTETEHAWNDKAQVGRMFDTLGPAGFLAQATSTDVAGVRQRYAKATEAHKVMDTLNGLETGPRMGEIEKANLAKWWNQSGETNIQVLIKMFEVRFRVSVSSSLWQRITQNGKDKHLATWTVDGLQHCWTVCERLPPAQVEGNPGLVAILRNSAGSNGNAYFTDLPASGGLVVMGQKDGPGGPEGLGAQTDWTSTVNQVGGQGVDAAGNPSAAANVNMFNATLRHEIGHAVDNQLHIMEGGWMHQEVAGAWQKYGSWSAFVDAIIGDFGGLTESNGVPAGKAGKWRDALLRTARAAGAKTFRQALTEVDSSTSSISDTDLNKGPASALWEGKRWTDVNDGPWYNPAAQPAGASGRGYQSAYKDDDSLWSYKQAVRNARGVTMYQWRAPGEWFAECYQVYYSEQEQGPNVPVGGRLRSRDPEAANMLSQLVDRGFSPQEMRGDRSHTAQATGVVAPPGTPRP
jgi:hypothetical protein